MTLVTDVLENELGLALSSEQWQTEMSAPPSGCCIPSNFQAVVFSVKSGADIFSVKVWQTFLSAGHVPGTCGQSAGVDDPPEFKFAVKLGSESDRET